MGTEAKEALLWMSAFIGLVLIIGYWIGKPKVRKSQPSLEKDELRQLVRSCFGDKAKAERLIKYELLRAPWIDRNAAIQMALEQAKQRQRNQIAATKIVVFSEIRKKSDRILSHVFKISTFSVDQSVGKSSIRLVACRFSG